MTRDDDKPKVDLPFQDPKGMFGTSPIDKELTDEEVEYLTSRTAPRARLTRSRRKIFLYSTLFIVVMFLLRLIYIRTAPITGLAVPPVLSINGWGGFGETGLVAVCLLIPAINWFLVPREDASVRWLIRGVGTFLPLAALGLLYALPPELLHQWTLPLYPGR